MTCASAQRHRQHIWHPYTKFSSFAAGPLPEIVRGEGIYLFDSGGRRYIDAISSWWACALGHNHPRVVRAIQKQAGELQHSILGNLSHPRAAELAERLASLMPSPDRHVLFSSDGASAVEAALKIAVQYWHNRGQAGRTQFVSLENAYHGDTLGTVSLGYLDHFHRPFQPLLFPAHRADPHKGFEPMAELLECRLGQLAAVIVEPLCQCAAGMKMYPADYLARLARSCREKKLLLIVDEIATGMGRTGKMFAFEHAGIDPDIVCVGKALSAGYLPISAAIVRDEIYHTFGDRPEDHTFYHGHTFSGNPIAAAAALETLQVFEDEDILGRARASGEQMRECLEPLASLPAVKEVRCLGLIGAVELKPGLAWRVRDALLRQGILVRPLGDVVYLMPPLLTPLQVIRELGESLRLAVADAMLQL